MNLMAYCLLSILLLFNYCATNANAAVSAQPDIIFIHDSCTASDSSTSVISVNIHDSLLLASTDSVKPANFKSKKLIAAILAFPVPFGLLGLHRLALGTKPYIPFVYIGTIGGCFLILPILDFIAILSANEEVFKHFENNPKVFMWSH